MPDAISHPRNCQVWTHTLYDIWWQQPSRESTCWWCFHCIPQVIKPLFQSEKMLLARVPKNLLPIWLISISINKVAVQPGTADPRKHMLQHWQIAQRILGQRKKRKCCQIKRILSLLNRSPFCNNVRKGPLYSAQFAAVKMETEGWVVLLEEYIMNQSKGKFRHLVVKDKYRENAPPSILPSPSLTKSCIKILFLVDSFHLDGRLKDLRSAHR